MALQARQTTGLAKILETILAISSMELKATLKATAEEE